jgi:hypothetical protein
MGDGDNEGRVVLADAQFGLVRILRPYPNFETNYDGVVATTPIMLSEGGVALDDLAARGETGYDRRLVRGLQVPVGARVLIWIPLAAAAALPTIVPYDYTIIWRYRNVHDYRVARLPYHYPKQGVGVPETLVNAGPRVVIPAATQSVIYNQAEGADFSFATQNLHSENIAMGGASLGANPINPDGADGAIQQGIQPSTATDTHTRPFFSPVEVQAEGDELLLAVTRPTVGQNANWDFTGVTVDGAFSNIYGVGTGAAIPDLGVYVVVGSAP